MAKDIESTFLTLLREDFHMGTSPAIVAVKVLIQVIENYKGTTINGLMQELKEAKTELKESAVSADKSRMAVNSACAQFIRYTTLYIGTLERETLSSVQQCMVNEGQKYLKRCENAIPIISTLATPFVFDGAQIMAHSYSRVVIEALCAVPDNIFFTVYVVSPDDCKVCKRIENKENIEVVKIADAEVGTRMEKVDMVFTGAEAVVKNGGIINKVGTLSLAICAKEMNKPLYVFAESFKFSLLYPLNQDDIPKESKVDPVSGKIRVDYTPPKYITFLITDRGLLTPVAVCDELIELYT